MNTHTRRQFLATASLAGAASLILPLSCASKEQVSSRLAVEGRIKIGVSSYSWWHFRDPKTSIESVIDKAAALGLEGVEVLHRQMEREDNDYLQKIKKHAFENGIDLISLSIHQDFVWPDQVDRQKHIDHTLKCIEIAYKMGIPSIRLNSGRWKTIKSFDDLMANKGQEPILEGYTEADGFNWCIDSIKQCMAKAEECGVTLMLENHWGLSSTPEGMLRIYEGVNSPWLQLMVDTGNFMEDPYDRIEKLAPYVKYMHAKTYYGGGEWYTLELDYERIITILKKANYKGYISIEFEGKDPGDTGVAQSVNLLRNYIGAVSNTKDIS